MPCLAKNIIHISEAKAASDFAGVLARARAGEDLAKPVRGRSISECIALAKTHEEETGKIPVFNADFAADVEEIVTAYRPKD